MNLIIKYHNYSGIFIKNCAKMGTTKLRNLNQALEHSYASTKYFNLWVFLYT